MQAEVELTNISKDKFTYQNISRPIELQFKLNNFSVSAFKFDYVNVEETYKTKIMAK